MVKEEYDTSDCEVSSAVPNEESALLMGRYRLIDFYGAGRVVA